MALPKISPETKPTVDDADGTLQRADAGRLVDRAVQSTSQLERGRRIMTRRAAVLTELAK